MKKFTAFLAVALLVVFVAGCSDDDCPTCPPDTGDTTPNLSYVGSTTCGTAGCHDATYNMFIESGHPYKLTAVPGNQGPTYPWDAQHTSGGIVSRDGPPPTTAWTDYAYVIGGYGWKARFVKPDGKIYTATATAQLNLWGPTAEWVDYHLGEDRPYDYSCFKCHTTGASDQGSWAAGTPGLGTFAFGGVQCEECHGRGSQHASDPPKYEMAVDRTSDLCGRCHTRDPQNRVEVSGGYIRHHEQYDEMVHSPHAAVGCLGCHDPHASVVYDNVAMGNGVTTPCLTCHSGYDTNNQHNSTPTCTDCHMAEAAKSARVTSNPYVADIASHTFQINTAAVDKSAMWTSDGKFLKLDEFGRGRVTLDFACYSCHKDATGAGGSFSQKTLAELSAKAQGIHTP
jgi:predicted CXXCH cytochrome family protein